MKPGMHNSQTNLQDSDPSVAPTIVIATLYRFARLPDYRILQPPLLDKCLAAGIQGTLLLAEEGINGTIAGPRAGVDAVLNYLRADPRLADLEHRESLAEVMPFHRLKVRLRKEIVTMGIPTINPERRAGVRVGARQWNELISDPEMLVIDTRNHYEHAIGTFPQAVSPGTQSFRQFPRYVQTHLAPARDKKVAMFCTGGIRCEKATAYLLAQGFAEVYHLHGGILKYLAEVQPEENLWQGECFVFDGRVAVDRNLGRGSHAMCYSCRMPLTPADRESDLYEEGVSCPHCQAVLTRERRARLRERQRQVRLAVQRNIRHIGAPQKPRGKS